jgi:predicted ArsR family transcriptional regulator
MQDRLLRAIASRGGATAQDVAKAVGVSLRVAQQALADLSADGSCLATKEGRKVRYAVEDTTFSEPTIHD